MVKIRIDNRGKRLKNVIAERILKSPNVYLPHFTVEETEELRGDNLSSVMLPVCEGDVTGN